MQHPRIRLLDRRWRACLWSLTPALLAWACGGETDLERASAAVRSEATCTPPCLIAGTGTDISVPARVGIEHNHAVVELTSTDPTRIVVAMNVMEMPREVWVRIFDEEYQPIHDLQLDPTKRPARPDVACHGSECTVVYAELDGGGIASANIEVYSYTVTAGPTLLAPYAMTTPDVAIAHNGVRYVVAWGEDGLRSVTALWVTDSGLGLLGGPSWRGPTSALFGAPPDVVALSSGDGLFAWGNATDPEDALADNAVHLTRSDSWGDLTGSLQIDNMPTMDRPPRAALAVNGWDEVVVAYRSPIDPIDDDLQVKLAFLDASGTFLLPPSAHAPYIDRPWVGFVGDDAFVLLYEESIHGDVVAEVLDFPGGTPIVDPVILNRGSELAKRPNGAIREIGPDAYEILVTWEQGDPDEVHGIVLELTL